MSALEGFKEMDVETVPQSRGITRDMLDEFLASGAECMGKPMKSKDDRKLSATLRQYVGTHPEYKCKVRVSGAGGILRLIRLEEGELE